MLCFDTGKTARDSTKANPNMKRTGACMDDRQDEVYFLEDDYLKKEEEKKAEIRKIVGYTILILAVIAIVGLIWAFLDVLFLIFIFILLGLPAIILVNLFRR